MTPSDSSAESLSRTMIAAVYERYGQPNEVLELREIARPTPGDDEVLVEVSAASVNALDWHLITGTPYIARLSMGIRKPKRRIPGADISGVIQETGKNVARFARGDEVFGEIAGRGFEVSGGGFAQYVVAAAAHLAPRPDNLPLEDTASLGVAALTALQALRDWGQMQEGQSVLINGASGGVGTFAVQIARALGASEVTAVCSTQNVETAASLGADLVIDYTKQDFTETGRTYDLMFDNVGNRSLGECRSMLTRDGTYVMVTGPKGRWLAPIPRLVGALVRSMLWTQRVVSRTATQSTEDLLYLKDLVETGRLTPVIERMLPLSEAASALDDQGSFHARGKTLISPQAAS